MGKTVSGMMLALLLIGILTSVFNVQPVKAEPRTIIVPDEYPTIQAAVDAANPGDMIVVREGTYTENVKVNKDHLTIKSESGAEVTIIQATDPDDNVIYVTANYVSINGFTVEGGNGIGDGIFIWRVTGASITNCKVKSCEYGIDMGESTNGLIENNVVQGNKFNGIDFWNCSDVVAKSNDCSLNNAAGFQITRTSAKIIGNLAENNKWGISLYQSSNNEIKENSFVSNWIGIQLDEGSNNNKIYLNNFIENTLQTAIFNSFNNIWNSPEKITYTYDGKTYINYLGNYWSDYMGSDANGDGIGDTPYSIDGDKDNYPLMTPWSLAETWSFDTDFQYNLDNNYETVEGGGHIRGTATLSGLDLLIQGEVSLSDSIPSQIPTVYLIATDGLDKEYARQIVDLSQFTYSQTTPNTYTFQGKILNAIKPVNSGHYEVSTKITYNSQQYEFFINTNSRINNHYLPLTTLPPMIPTYIQGIDVSHWQENIDWSKVYEAGYRFAFVKATEGVGWVDPNFVINMVNGRNAGLLMGAYHFARPDLGNTAQDEALYFISVAGNYLKSGWLRPALDLEVGSALGKEALSKWVEEWMETVKKETGVEPIIYVHSNYASNYLNVSLAKYNLWIAHWTYDINVAPNTGIWSSWDFWQYSDKGSVPGISGTVDLDLFNGDVNRLYDVFVSNRPPIVKFEIIPENPAVGEEVIFDASSSHDPYGPDGSVVSYEWDFGDGSHITTYLPKASHAYSETGPFTVTLRVTDDRGATSSAQTSVTVKRFWSFAIITDIHMGYGIPDFGEEGYENDGNGQDYWLTTRLKNTVEKIKSLNTDNNNDYYIRFVVVLGDIVDTAEESEFKKAKEILDRLNDAGIPYIPIFGNHEAWPYTQLGLPWPLDRVIASEASSPIGDQYFEKYFFGEGANRNMDLIKKLFGDSWKKMPNPAGSDYYLQNYRFSYEGIKFICLDFITREHWDRISEEMGGIASYTPIGGVGSDAELYPLTLWWLNISLVKEDVFPKEPTVIFSHHPIWVNLIDAFSDDECEKIHSVIRESPGSEVIANFAGHIHENKMSAEPWFTVIATDAIYHTTENIIRIVKVDAKTKNIDYLTLESVEWEGYLIPYEEYAGSTVAILQSPGELRVYDEQDRVTGWVNGTLRNDIPNSTIYENMIFLSNIQGPYRYEIKGISGGYYTLIIANFTRTGDSIAAFTASNITTTENSTHQYIVDWASLSQGEEGVTVQVDSDGDGIFENAFTSDSELNHDEFVLQTEMTVDFDPNTLDLKSKGKRVTVYIELPEGYDVADINVSTILLNNTIPVDVNASIAIGDYDNNSIHDLMVKFDRAEVISYILANVDIAKLYENKFMTVTLTISGELNNGTPFKGICTFKSIFRSS